MVAENTRALNYRLEGRDVNQGQCQKTYRVALDRAQAELEELLKIYRLLQVR